MDSFIGLQIPQMLSMLKPGMSYETRFGTIAHSKPTVTLGSPSLGTVEFAIVLLNGALWHPILLVQGASITFYTAKGDTTGTISYPLYEAISYGSNGSTAINITFNADKTIYVSISGNELYIGVTALIFGFK